MNAHRELYLSAFICWGLAMFGKWLIDQGYSQIGKPLVFIALPVAAVLVFLGVFLFYKKKEMQ
ncbi:MAG: hypothetical protein CL799_11690 [Chromatiales bacterium]|jgi:hypothetical protein|nr:hypothetical protein [Chromatiales bacterium]MDP6149697.1 hypothetical protein [Gammaproteobacteria bacterium]MDP7271879.1 hypothetical protein [Gammaproteobacteria bacterium]HJP04085.1 hypothetical protein [Gammaproteobacteria bacterium]